MNLIKIKTSDLKRIREELLVKQKWRCKICQKNLKKEYEDNPKGVHVDHQHFGEKRIRSVLCRRCNSLEGKFYNSYKRLTKKEDKSEEDMTNYLKGLIRYYKLKPSRYIYPERKKRRKKKKEK